MNPLPLTLHLSLSPRQREVFDLLVSGESTASIAVRLGCAVKTVEAHRAAVYRRLHAHSAADLVRIAFGGAPPPPPPSLAALTPAERRVFDLVVRGVSTPAIAQQLGRSEHTVVAYRNSIHQRLGTGTPADLVRLAQVEAKADAAQAEAEVAA